MLLNVVHIPHMKEMLLSWYSFNLIWCRLPKLVIIGNHDTRQRKYGIYWLYNTWSLVYEKECISAYSMTRYWITYPCNLFILLSSKNSGWKCFVNFWHVHKAVFFKEDINDFRRFWWHTVYSALNYQVLWLILSYCHF